MTDDTRSARYHANVAADYCYEAETTKQQLPQETDNQFMNRVGKLRFKAQNHAGVAQALALTDISDHLYGLSDRMNR